MAEEGSGLRSFGRDVLVNVIANLIAAWLVMVEIDPFRWDNRRSGQCDIAFVWGGSSLRRRGR
jgi:hypothetical protein